MEMCINSGVGWNNFVMGAGGVFLRIGYGLVSLLIILMG